MHLPSDPNLLLSVVNTKLRDNYSSLQEFCDDCDIDMEEFKGKLKEMSLRYDEGVNQLKSI